jgi:hypothetical protein
MRFTQRLRAPNIAIHLALLSSLTVACEREQAPSPAGTGDAHVAVLALSVADVDTVRVSVVDADPPIVASLSRVGDEWVGIVGAIPAGSDRTLAVSVRDAGGTEIYRGESTGVAITAGQTTSVAITAQEVAPAQPLVNAAPVIDALVASALAVAPGEVVNLRATAHDPNPADTLTYEWSAPAGTFDAPTSPMTRWTAPATGGNWRLNVRVRDQRNAQATMSVEIEVSEERGRGRASLRVTVNTWPVVEDITASPTRIDAGETTTLDVIATDSDADPLAYAWTSECAGAFSDTAVKAPTFTLAARPATGACTLTAQITDGRGGSNSATLTIAAGPAPAVDSGPEIVGSFQSSATANGGQALALRATAVDPEGTALTFAWTASTGTLGTPATMGGTSEVSWTAPQCFPAGSTAEVRVRITDAAGSSAEEVFTVGAGSSAG